MREVLLALRRVANQAVYLDGICTEMRLRPFRRRRLKVSRPHFVSIRARKPCLRIRRVLRGRYVGLPMTILGERCCYETKTERSTLARE